MPLFNFQISGQINLQPASFAPTDISGLRLWLKADSLSLNDGDAVSSWADGSSNADNAVQIVGAAQPTYKASILNGKPVVRFDGSSDFMIGTLGGTIAQPLTVIAVRSASNPATDGNVLGSIAAVASGSYYIHTDGKPGVYGGAVLLGSSAISGAHVVAGVFNGASSAIYVDGSAAATGNAGSAGFTNGYALGTYNSASPSDLFAFDLAELLIYNSVLSDANRQSVEAYLKTRWGTP